MNKKQLHNLARKIVATRLQEIYGEYITQGSADDWYEDADRVLALTHRLRPLLADYDR